MNISSAARAGVGTATRMPERPRSPGPGGQSPPRRSGEATLPTGRSWAAPGSAARCADCADCADCGSPIPAATTPGHEREGGSPAKARSSGDRGRGRPSSQRPRLPPRQDRLQVHARGGDHGGATNATVAARRRPAAAMIAATAGLVVGSALAAGVDRDDGSPAEVDSNGSDHRDGGTRCVVAERGGDHGETMMAALRRPAAATAATAGPVARTAIAAVRQTRACSSKPSLPGAAGSARQQARRAMSSAGGSKTGSYRSH